MLVSRVFRHECSQVAEFQWEMQAAPTGMKAEKVSSRRYLAFNDWRKGFEVIVLQWLAEFHDHGPELSFAGFSIR